MFNNMNNLRNTTFSRSHYNINNEKINQKNVSNSLNQRNNNYKSLDGRTWENYENMINANREIYKGKETINK